MLKRFRTIKTAKLATVGLVIVAVFLPALAEDPKPTTQSTTGPAAPTKPASCTTTAEASQPVLELRIAPMLKTVQNDLPKYAQDLKENGPDSLREKNGDYIWVPTGFKVENPLLATVEHKGKTYVLLSNRDSETMVSGNAKDGWGLLWAKKDTDAFGRPAVSLRIDATGAKLLKDLTANHIRQPLALIVAGKAWSIPVINQAIEARVIIAGSFTDEEVDMLVNTLKAAIATTKPADK